LLISAISQMLNAQIPSYIPKDSLVGWWPFNGNANDESGNGHNGTVNGATLTSDRTGNIKSCYEFNGSSNFIEIQGLSNFKYSPVTISCWVNTYTLDSANFDGGRVIIGRDKSGMYNEGALMLFNYTKGGISNNLSYYNGNTCYHSTYKFSINNWVNIAYVTDKSDSITFYIDGRRINKQKNSVHSNAIIKFLIGAGNEANNIAKRFFWHGKIDDIAVWGRALDSNEIKKIFTGCSKTSTHPKDISINKTKSATFNAKHSDSTYTALWQSKHVDLPWNYIISNNTYTIKSNSLTLNNLSVSNHNQKFRVIYKNKNCQDTSSTATLIINDTCNNTAYDTISVQDTLIINAKLTGTTPLKTNLIKVYPNPAKEYLVIDFGNYASMADYEINIVDVTGKSVYSSAINKASETIDLNKWTDKGIYFIKIFDKQNQQIENRKIVIQ